MKNGIDINNIDKSEFEFVQSDQRISDTKFETKRIGYLHDALRRFAQNKGSVVAAIVLLFLAAFSIITPFFSGHTTIGTDPYYTYCEPKSELFEGTGFWDGTRAKSGSINTYIYYREFNAIAEKSDPYQKYDPVTNTSTTYYDMRIDTYTVGYVYKSFDEEEFLRILDYDEKVGDDEKVLAKMVDLSWARSVNATLYNNLKQNANYSYKVNSKMVPEYTLDDNGEPVLTYTYEKDSDGNYVYYKKSSIGGFVSYSVRMSYDNYYLFVNGKRPLFVLGSDKYGRDVMTRLASGGRLSLALGISVAAVNILIGIIYGSIEGFYGGATDLIMERISDILTELPFTVVVVLFNSYNADSGGKLSPAFLLFFAFVFTGWIGTAATVRMQFYRFKNQEYVLAAKTLGSGDARLIFRHILPNAVGTIVTSSVLMVPGVIFTESSLSFLKIIDFESSGITSIGLMLSDGQTGFTSYPNLVLWPALFISLLMICFNVFGNGLRDAFNPQLRGSEE